MSWEASEAAKRRHLAMWPRKKPAIDRNEEDEVRKSEVDHSMRRRSSAVEGVGSSLRCRAASQNVSL